MKKPLAGNLSLIKPWPRWRVVNLMVEKSVLYLATAYYDAKSITNNFNKTFNKAQ